MSSATASADLPSTPATIADEQVGVNGAIAAALTRWVVGQRVLGAAADRRTVQTYENTEAIFAQVADHRTERSGPPPRVAGARPGHAAGSIRSDRDRIPAGHRRGRLRWHHHR